MGICASSPISRNGESLVHWSATAKIIHPDGRLQELERPIRAGHVLAERPDHFLCSSESMHVDSHVPHVADEEELQLGQLYFLVPLSMSHSPLSLQRLCSLAVKASRALSGAGMRLHGAPAGLGAAGVTWEKNETKMSHD